MTANDLESFTHLADDDLHDSRNTLVANSDFQAFTGFIQERKKELEGSFDHGLQRKYQCALLISFLRDAQQICEPVTDKIFFMHSKQLESQGRYNGAFEATDEVTSMDFEISDYDDDELLDTSVLERVRTLRDHVRKQAKIVAEVKQEVLLQVTQLSRIHVEDLERSIGVIKSAQSRDDNSMKGHEFIQQDPVYAKAIEKVSNAVCVINGKLLNVRDMVPLTLGRWQKQLEAIQIGQQWSLSQTEQTVREQTVDTLIPDNCQISADQRLVHFLC